MKALMAYDTIHKVHGKYSVQKDGETRVDEAGLRI